MSDREEIRWKFQVMFDAMDTVIQLLENERTGLQNNLEKYAHERKEIRNTLLGMIAFGIGLLVSLISIKIIEGDTAWYIIPALIGAGAIYLITNIGVYSTALKFHKLNSKYLLIIEELIKIKGHLSGKSLNEEIKKEQVVKVIQYSYLIGQIFAYELGHFGHNIIKSPKPNQEQYREAYDIIKQNLDEIKEIGVKDHKIRFDLFLKEFEKNEKSKIS
ncbi:MAG: hypothetical protein IIA83_07295 [Thaumarchaeota archaeon]|nr:hypothetical protein [Nitrososphaerota archaeon]